MTTIREDASLFTVIVTVDADAADLPPLEEHASAGLDLFKTFPGFIGGALHVSHDGGRLVQYLQWEAEAAYNTAVDDPRWDHWPSAIRFLDFVRTGRATMDVRAYGVRRTV